MSNKHSKPTDEARDELFSHIQRCGVLQATKEHQEEWLGDTMGFLAGRYPELDEQQIMAVEAMGRRYLQPVVPHGADTHAGNRDEWQGKSEAPEGVEAQDDAEEHEGVEEHEGAARP